MATDFFERQSNARSSTRWLVVMFVVAVIAIVGSISAITAFGVATWNQNPEFHAVTGTTSVGAAADPIDPWKVPFFAGAGTLALIVFGSLYKVAGLRGGGTSVAESVGGAARGDQYT